MGRIVLFLIGLLLMASGVMAAIIQVGPGQTYTTIQAAIDAASAGDVIQIGAGDYTESPISLNKAVTLKGPNAGIAGAGTRGSEARIVNTKITITAAATIDGLEIYQTNDAADAILVQAAATVKNSVIQRFGVNTGIIARGITTAVGTTGFSIKNNLFTGDASGGFFSGHKTWNSGIWLNGGSGSVDGNTVQNCRTAINADDFNAGISISGNTIQNSGTFIAFGGTTPTNGQFVLGANSFNSLLSTFINLSNVDAAFRLDITSSTYGGVAFSSMSPNDLFGIELTMYHRGRSGRNGLVYYVADNQYVIPANPSIQAAVDYATASDVINVAAGTYAEALTINKANITLQSSGGRDVTFIDIPFGTLTTGIKILQNLGTVKIDGFTVKNFTEGGIIQGMSQATGTAAQIFNCKVTPYGDYLRNGIQVSGDGSMVIGNIVDGAPLTQAWSSTGINVVNASNVIVRNNTVNHGMADIGIGIINWSGTVANILVENNTVIAPRYSGIGISGVNTTPYRSVSDVIIRNNILKDAVDGDGIGVWFATANNLEITGNEIYNNRWDGFYVSGTSGNLSGTVTLNQNKIYSNQQFAIHNGSVYAINATCNWWGSTDIAMLIPQMDGPANYLPALSSGTDTDASTPGFQPATGTCTVEGPVSIGGTQYATLQQALDAANDGDVITVLAGGTYGGVTFNNPGETVTLTTASGVNVTIVGASPALTVNAGDLIVQNGISFTTATYDPTILVNGGSLTMTNCTITESTAFNQTGVMVTGGTVNLGTLGTPGHNTFITDGTGKAVTNNSTTAVNAIGNYWGSVEPAEIVTKIAGTGTVNWQPWCNDDFTICDNYDYAPVTSFGTPVEISCGVWDFPVIVTNFQHIGAISLVLNYDATALQYQDVVLNTVISTALIDYSTAGTFYLAQFPTPDVSLNNGDVLFTLRFSLLPAAAGTNPALVWSSTPQDCEYGAANGDYVYTSTFNNLGWTLPARPVKNTTTGLEYCKIQEAIDATQTLAGHTLTVGAGSFNEDINVNKSITLIGAGYALTTVSGPIGGVDGATIRISAPGVVIDGFHITRDGNNLTDWNLSTLNFAGIAIQGQTNNVEARNCWIEGNRTGIDVNNSNGNNIHDNLIDNNRTGLLFRNQTDNTILVNNYVTNNWTVGILFLDASGGDNDPVQSALNSQFNNNDISGNWYGQIVDRQSGVSLPAPGTTNMKDFECNWYGTVSPVVSTANSAEPGYPDLIPVVYGGTATAPGGQPDILGPASANFDYILHLADGTDNNTALGFQPVPGACGSCTEIQEFDVVTTSSTQAPGVWYTDRYAPYGFATEVFDGQNRLKHSIDAADCESCRPASYSSSFYNTQGRKYDIPTGINSAEIDLYVPAAWATTGRRMAGLWATAFDASDAVSAYPIVEFTSDGGKPRFRGWESGTGTWVDLGLPAGFVYDTWVNLRIELLPSGEFRFVVGNIRYETNTSAPDATVRLANMILQGYNTASPGVTYDIYWDNLQYAPLFANASVSGMLTCTNNSVDVIVSAQGGQAPYLGDIGTYTYTVSQAGTYTYTVTDAYGCSVTTEVSIPYLPVKNATQTRYYATIQEAINDGNANDVIEVCAGTYPEHVNINKALDIRGPNYGISGTGTRVAEALIVPAANMMPGDIWTEVVYINSGNVKFDGFTVSGDNPAITGYSYAGMNLEKGQCINSEGSNVTIQNNIVANATTMGIFAGGSQSTQYNGLVISNNKIYNIHDIAQLGYGFGMYVQGTAGQVTNNTVTDCRNGIQVQPYRVLEGSTPSVVSNNSFSVYKSGIYYNYAEVGASAWTITGNTVTACQPPSTPTGPLAWEGIKAETMMSTANGGTISGNIVNGSGAATDNLTWWAVYGMRYAGSYSTSTQVFFTNNTVSNVEIGFVHDAAADIVLTGNSLSASGKAISVQRFYNSAGVAQAYGGVNNIDATGGNTYNAVASGAATLPQLFAIEDLIDHKVDESWRGLVTVTPLNTYVTTNSFIAPATTTPSIQRGIDAASNGWTVNVTSGTFTENILIGKPLTLLGANANIPCAAGRGAETVIQPSSAGTTPVSLTGAGSSDNVTINGFEITGTMSNNAIYCGGDGPSGLKIIFNYIHDIGTGRGSGNVYAINYRVNDPNTSNVNISDNCIENVLNNTSLALGNSAAIWLGQSTATGVVSNLTIQRNIIKNIFSYSTKDVSGIYLGVASGTGTGGINIPLISENEISNIRGGIAYGVQLSGKTPGAIVRNNIIDNVTSSTNATYVAGVAALSTNTGSATITINENSFTNTLNSIVNGTASAISSTCNWYGNSSVATASNATIGLVTYEPWLVTGTDNDVAIGFQPVPNSCTGAANLYVNDLVSDNGTNDIYTTAIGADANAGTAAAPFLTITKAVNTAVDGTQIWVDAGTFQEQVFIGKTVDITGADYTKTSVKAPVALQTTPISIWSANEAVNPIIFAYDNTKTINLSKLTVDGDGGRTVNKYFGVLFYEANGSFTFGKITGIRDAGSFSGAQAGIAYYGGHIRTASLTQNLAFTNNIVDDFQKGGVVVDAPGTIGIIDNNTIIGQNVPLVTAQNGIQLSRGAGGSIQGNTVSNCIWNKVEHPHQYTAAGILLYQAGATTVSGNTLSGNELALNSYGSAGVTYGVNTFSNNKIHLWLDAVSDINAANVYDKYVLDPTNNPEVVFGCIQYAIDEATAGDLLNASAGTFIENVNVHTSVSLNGAASLASIIDGGGAGTVVTIAANNTTLNGFKVQNSGATATDAGVKLTDGGMTGVTGCTITNNEITTFNGLGIIGGSANSLTLNNIHNNAAYGALLIGTSGNTIESNTISNTGLDGIALDNASVVGGPLSIGSTGNFIKSNTISNGGRDGIFIGENCSGNYITDGNVLNTIASIGINVWRPSGQTITDNSITNALTGIRLLGSSNNTITGNTLTTNGTGIIIDPSWQSGVWYSSNNNTISGNTIADNTLGMDADDVNQNLVTAEINWWGDASGPYHATLNPCGLGNAVTDNVDFSPWYFQSGMTTLNGIPPVTLTAVPDYATVTGAPVIFSTTAGYTEDMSGYDDQVLTDNRITSTLAFPAGSQVISVKYDGTEVLAAPYNLGGKTTVYLSDILGLPAAGQLNEHTMAMTPTWTITVAGFDGAASYGITLDAVSYITAASACNNVLGTEPFSVTFADLAMATTDPEQVCEGSPVISQSTVTYPSIAPTPDPIPTNPDPIKADVKITFNQDIQAGAYIEWTVTPGMNPPGPSTLRTYTFASTLTAGTPILMSTIINGSLPVPSTPGMPSAPWPLNWAYVTSSSTYDMQFFGLTPAAYTSAWTPIALLGTTEFELGFTGTTTQAFTVNDCGISGVLNYYNNASSLLKNVPVSLYQNGTPVLDGASNPIVSTTDATLASYSFTSLPAGTYELRPAKTDEVRSINATDAAQVNYWNVNNSPIEKVRFLAGDVARPASGSSSIVAYDAQQILVYFVSAGTHVWTNAPSWSFYNAGQTISANPWAESIYPKVTITNTPMTNQTIYGMVTGDFNRSWTPSSKGASQSLSLNDGQMVQVAPNTEILLPITAAHTMEVGAISLILTYPDDKVTIDGVYLGNNPAQPMLFNANNGVVRIGWTSPMPMELLTGNTLITLKLRTASNLGSNETIRFELADDPLNELADGQSQVISPASLIADLLVTSTTGLTDMQGSNLHLTCYPNPFTETTTIQYYLPVKGFVTLDLFDLVGQKVTSLVAQHADAGSHSLCLQSTSISSGVYLARITFQYEGKTVTRTIKLVRQD